MAPRMAMVREGSLVATIPVGCISGCECSSVMGRRVHAHQMLQRDPTEYKTADASMPAALFRSKYLMSDGVLQTNLAHSPSSSLSHIPQSFSAPLALPSGLLRSNQPRSMLYWAQRTSIRIQVFGRPILLGPTGMTEEKENMHPEKTQAMLAEADMSVKTEIC